MLALDAQVYKNYWGSMFYGANGHFDYSQTIAQQIAGLQLMGMTSYRVTYENSTASLNYLVSLAQALAGTNITPIVCIDLDMAPGGTLYASEGAAYAGGFAAGQTVAQALAPYGVNFYETGNELDAKNGIRIPVQAVQGGIPQDFANSLFPILRGVINGCMAAIRTYQPAALIVSNAFTACSTACADMLWDGRQPDGSYGWPQLRWDVTNWHNYEDYGLMSQMSMDFQKPTTNVWDHLMCKYGRPIICTEWNGKQSDTDAQRATWATTFLNDATKWAKLFPGSILAVCVYQLFNGTPWGVLNADGTVESTFGTTVKNYIAANPL